MLFNFNKQYIIDIVTNNKIISWPILYNELGIAGILSYLNKYDVRNIYSNNDFIIQINEIMTNNLLKLKKGEYPKEYKSLCILKDKYKIQSIGFDHMNYAPKHKYNVEGLSFVID